MCLLRWVAGLSLVSVVMIGVAIEGDARDPAGSHGAETARQTVGDVDETKRVQEPAPVATWRRAFGGVSMDTFHSVKETAGGGYIVVGDERSWGAGGSDGWVMKLDSGGNKVWSGTFGGSGLDVFACVDQTGGGGYIVAGYEGSWGQGFDDAWLLRLDSSGNKAWARTFGGTSYDGFDCVQETSDGGYVVAGYTESWGTGGGDGWVMKLSSTGSKTWSKTYGGTDDDYFASVQETSDGGYIVAGYEYSWGQGQCDGWVMKLDSSGNTTWSRTLGGTSDDTFFAVRETSGGEYVVAGYETSWGAGASEGWVVKLSSTGSKQWGATFGGSGQDKFRAVGETSDGGYIVAGDEDSWGAGAHEGWLMKLSSSGGKVWAKTYGGTSADTFRSLQATADSGYIVAGAESSWGAGLFDGWVLKLDSSGNK